MIGELELGTMRPGAYLVNAGRGDLVDGDALRRAIEGGRLAGAAMDVREHETDGRNAFADLPDVIVTPHVGGAVATAWTGWWRAQRPISVAS